MDKKINLLTLRSTGTGGKSWQVTDNSKSAAKSRLHKHVANLWTWEVLAQSCSCEMIRFKKQFNP